MGRSNSYPGEPTPLPESPLPDSNRANQYDRFRGIVYSSFLSRDNIPVAVNPQTHEVDLTGAVSSIYVFLGNTEDTLNWTFTKADVGCTSTLTGNTITITGFVGPIAYVDITATRGEQTFTKRVGVFDIYTEGQVVVGADAPSFRGVSPVLVVSGTYYGEIIQKDYTLASSTLKVFEGGADVTAQWSFSVVNHSNVTPALNAGVLSVSNFVDTGNNRVGYVTVQATRTNYSNIQLILPVILVVEGQSITGDPGEDGVTPSFRINGINLEVSYNSGSTWSSLGQVVGADGTDGINGTNGTNGTNGVNGITPTFRINGSNLEVSYNGGGSWSNLGNVKGADGTNGDSAYVYIAYASDELGTDFTTDSSVGKYLPYIAILSTTSPIATPIASNFEGLWQYIIPVFGNYEAYRLTLPAAGSVAARCAAAVEGVNYPVGWTLAADVNPDDLLITHTTGKRASQVTIFSISGSNESLLIGNAAYSTVNNLGTTQIRIQALESTGLAIAIYISFV